MKSCPNQWKKFLRWWLKEKQGILLHMQPESAEGQIHPFNMPNGVGLPETHI